MVRNYINRLFGLILFTTFAITASGQSNARIDNVDFYLDNNLLVITYDILNSRPTEKFDIWMKITATSGEQLTPVSVSGDIGSEVTGGNAKMILWDLEKDEVEIDEEITVEVIASASSQSAGEETIQDRKIEKVRKVSVGKAVIFSLLMPGAGNAYVTGGGSQWLWGVVGYGCIAGSVALNSRAYDLLEQYRASTDPTERDDLYQEAKTNDNVSKVLIGAAAAIWTVDLIWTAAQASRANREYRRSKLSFHYSYEPEHKVPLVGLTYKF